MTNVQDNSFSQEGVGESQWADGPILLPSSEMDGRPKMADAICLGEGHRHELNKVIVDLDVFADALEGRARRVV
jgi:hypothetical protein